jgi:glutamate-1-semialdehyde 2,1-aminomutase
LHDRFTSAKTWQRPAAQECGRTECLPFGSSPDEVAENVSGEPGAATIADVSDPKSKLLFARASKKIPGGVNSPVRAFRAVGGEPVFVDRALGAYLWGADGTRYTDYVGSWGPMILGHAHPAVVAAITEAAARGTSFGAPTELEVLFAEKVTELYPSIDMMRAVSSGTEATMAALRVARGFTKRDLIVKFEGCYHGHADALLVKAGSGLATLGVPDSAGVPAETAAKTLTLAYNDREALAALFAARGKEIAAVIVEPVVGNMGVVPPAPGFLEAIVSLCQDHGAVSIFDEVMTGCRVARGGMQARVGLKPAMTCLGKIVGGGMPLAVYGGRRDIMEQVAPLGPVYQAGTLSGNPVAVSAGLLTLERLDDALYLRLEALGARLEKGIQLALAKRQVKGVVQRVGSMITLFFREGPVRSWDDAKTSDTARFGRWHAQMIAEGQYWPPSQFEAAFFSGAHTESDIDKTLEAIDMALAKSA